MRKLTTISDVLSGTGLCLLLVLHGPSWQRGAVALTSSVKHPQPSSTHRYVAFYKPPLTLCTFRSDQDVAVRKHRRVRSTLADFDFPDGLHTVGRLDRDSEGLLLLTDDGKFTQDVCSPVEGGCQKRYLARVRGTPDGKALQGMRKGGLNIRGVVTRPPVSVDLVDNDASVLRNIPYAAPGMDRPGGSWVEVVLTEGRNRQVRKITAHAGFPSTRLVRVSIGYLDLLRNEDSLWLQPGEWRYICKDDVLGTLQGTE